jgi:hypothetical protein
MKPMVQNSLTLIKCQDEIYALLFNFRILTIIEISLRTKKDKFQ